MLGSGSRRPLLGFSPGARLEDLREALTRAADPLTPGYSEAVLRRLRADAAQPRLPPRVRVVAAPGRGRADGVLGVRAAGVLGVRAAGVLGVRAAGVLGVRADGCRSPRPALVAFGQ
jgi:hypothetical protein